MLSIKAIESWFNQFKHYFRLSNNGAITYNQLKEKVKISISKIPKQSYSNHIQIIFFIHIKIRELEYMNLKDPQGDEN
jgi:hypothetical protein